MSNIIFRSEDNVIYIEGAIDEWSSLQECFSAESNPLRLNMKGVSRINSSGVKVWMDTLSEFSDIKMALLHE